MWDWMRQDGSRGDRTRGLEEWSTTAFAESADGIHREKPNLGLFDVDGSRDNNIVWMGPGATWCLSRWQSRHTDDERLKAVAREGSLRRAGQVDVACTSSREDEDPGFFQITLPGIGHKGERSLDANDCLSLRL